MYKKISEPCRNFCIFATTTIIDPLDDREKIVLSSYVDSGTGVIVFIDRLTGQGETIEIPADDGAWAILNMNNEKLLVGTCSQYGYLHSLDLKTRKWAEPLRDKNEQYIWNLAKASDGMVYGGTWPGGVLLRYDPNNHTLTNLGHASDDPKNMYLRYVCGEAPGYVIATCMSSTYHLTAYDIKNKCFRRFSENGAGLRKVTDKYIITQKDDVYSCYDIKTLKKVENAKLPDLDVKDPLFKYIPKGGGSIVRLKDGSIAGVRGQEYFIIERDHLETKLIKIPGDAPSTRIMTITDDKKGKIWGSSALGQTIFSYDINSGKYQNSAAVCNNGGEVYGMQFIGDKLFLSAYAGGDHIVYDPGKEWNQIDNVNPKTLDSVAPDLIRPVAKSIIGPDGCYWTGWSAKYGTYGGGLSRVDPKSYKMTSWYDPIPGQTVIGLTCNEKYLFFTTSGEANGLMDKEDIFHFVVWDPENNQIYKDIRFDKGIIPGVVQYAGGFVAVAANHGIKLFDTEKMSFSDDIPFDKHISQINRYKNNKFICFAADEYAVIDTTEKKISVIGEMPGFIFASHVTDDDKIYFGHNTILYELIP